MAELTIHPRQEMPSSTTYQAPRTATGVVASVRLAPPDYALWLCDSELADGGTITWDGAHSDDGVYVMRGAVEIDGRTCPAGGAVIVESGVHAVARAVGPTRVVHVGSTDPEPPATGLFGAPDPDGHGIHVVGPRGRFQSGEREGVEAIWFADGTCPTCRIQLFTVAKDHSTPKRGKSHTHSQDEIIYLLDGEVAVGATHIAPETALCVPGAQRYAIVGGPDGHRFLNFRRDVSEQVNLPGSAPVLETAASRGGVATGDVR